MGTRSRNRNRGSGRRRSSSHRGCSLLILLALLAVLIFPPARSAAADAWLSLGLPHLFRLAAWVGIPAESWPVSPASESSELQPMEWDEASAPNYYLVVGQASFDVMPAIGDVLYSPLDALGRAGKAAACVDADLMSHGSGRERKDMGGLEPSGWGHNEEVEIELPTGNVYHGYFWNRSHLVAKSLGGDEVERNIVCGTRMQNVGANLNGTEGGMAYCETLVRNWLEQNPTGYVLYSATPVYGAGELVCRNVVVDIRTSDASIDQRVVVFNAAKGFDIDYATGQFVRKE